MLDTDLREFYHVTAGVTEDFQEEVTTESVPKDG